MSATLTIPYRRSIQDARRVAEAFRAATRGIDGKLLRERLQELAAHGLPETPEGRHSTGYVAVITEVAAASKPEGRGDARAFAQVFVSRPSAYSRTKAGLAAIQLEAWLIEHGGSLYTKFVETVLDNGDTQFLAIFEGKLSAQDADKLRTGVSGFVKLEPIAEAGAVNYDDAELLEFSMFNCTAVGTPSKDILPKSVDGKDDTQPTSPAKPTFESLMPQTRADYDRVFEQEGITRAVAKYILGAQLVERAKVEDGRLALTDRNGVRWVSENGDAWVPDVDSIDEGVEREADAEAEDAPAPIAPIYEANARTGALRSFCGTWAAFDNPVLVENETCGATIIAAHNRAWVVDSPLDEARSIIEDAARIYAASPIEGDLYIEAALAEYAEANGVGCVNESEVLQLVEHAPDRPTRADRDYDVRLLSTRRLEEQSGHGGFDAQALCAVIEQAMDRKAPGKSHWARFDNRFGQGGTVFIKFHNADKSASDVDKLNSKPNFTLAIDPFDNDGRAAAPKLKAKMLTHWPRDIGWRGKTAPPDVMARYIEAFIEKLDLDVVVEADDEGDKPEGKPQNPQ